MKNIIGFIIGLVLLTGCKKEEVQPDKWWVGEYRIERESLNEPSYMLEVNDNEVRYTVDRGDGPVLVTSIENDNDHHLIGIAKMTYIGDDYLNSETSCIYHGYSGGWIGDPYDCIKLIYEYRIYKNMKFEKICTGYVGDIVAGGTDNCDTIYSTTPYQGFPYVITYNIIKL